MASAATVTRYPVLAFASGPTNSMRGAAFLSGMADALVADVGGTTTDIGCIVGGFPREANNAVEVGGVRTLFRMPDLLSIGLGGGSIVSDAGRSVGPSSVGYRIGKEALVFGGPVLTATDVGVAREWVRLGDPGRLEDVDGTKLDAACETIGSMLEEAVDRMKTDARPEPLIAVGGGAFLIPDHLPGVSQVTRVPFHEVANAVGAAIAQVSGEVDRVFQGMARSDAIAEALRLARDRAVEAGAARDSLTTVEVEGPAPRLPTGQCPEGPGQGGR